MEPSVQQPHVALPNVPEVGSVVAEKYRVEGVLGVGGMGVVLAARHLQLGQLVAIKILAGSSGDQPSAVQRFLREGRVAAALTSDHVVRIYDLGQLPSGVPFMVMERLRGQDLAQLLGESGPLPIDLAVEYVAQATLAIAEAHDVGIIHRDLKPSNLFLTHRSDGSPCIKVLDFGISKQLTDLDAQTMRGALTSTRQAMGSPAYMSPEQVRDASAVDHRTDIWALGITLYELLTNQSAFGADTLPAMCAAIAADPAVPVRARRAEVPGELERIVLLCLEKSPDRRFPSARAFLAALRSFQGKSDTSRQPSDDGDLCGNAPAQQDQTQAAAQIDISVRDALKKPEILSQSGARAISLERLEAPDGTLISGRLADFLVEASSGQGIAPKATQTQGSEAAAGSQPSTRRSRSPWVLAAFSLVVIGVATVWFAFGNQRPLRNPDVSQPTSATLHEPPPVEAKTHFVLRIESTPSQALVLEGGNPIGVTPLAIDIDRQIVQKSSRQFIVRRQGYAEVVLQQGDSPHDVTEHLALPSNLADPIRATADTPDRATADPPRPRPSTRPVVKQPHETTSASPPNSPVDIRVTR